MLPDYDGGINFEIWLTQLRSAEKVYNVEKKILQKLLVNKFKGKGQQWLFSKPNFADQHLDDLLREMTEMFGNKENKLKMRRKFEARKWRYNETFHDYYNEKVVLSNGMGVEEDKFMEYVVNNFKDRSHSLRTLVCLGAVSAGTALAWTSPVLPQISIDPTANITTNSTGDEGLRLTMEEQTWVSSLLAIGAFIAALPTGYIADAIGRRYTALLIDIPFIVAWLLIIFAKSVGMLYVGRFLIGISTGGFCVVAPMYISEIAETSIRGTLGTLFQLTLSFGILFVYIVGALVPWITLSVLCFLIPVALFIGMLFLPETPTYLLKKGRRGDAALSLKWLWGRYCDSRSAIQIIQTDLDSVGGETSFMDLFRNKAAYNGLIISMLLMFFQQFSGVNAVIFYTVPIFKSAGSTLDPSACSIIVGLVQVVMTLLSSILIERAGRKVLLIFSSVCQATCLAILGLYFHMKDGGKDVSNIGWLPLLSVVLFMVTFSLGYGPIPWLMMGELFLPDVKATAVALTVMANWFSVFVVTKCFGQMIEAWGSDLTFWFFSFCMISATAYVWFMVFETKGRSAAQIQMLLGGDK